MGDRLERPKFLPSYIKALQQSAERRGWKALVPVWLVISGLCGAAASYFVSPSFWDHQDVGAIIYTGVLTLNGLILTLSWNAFSRIYESISAPVFVSYLMAKDKMNGYIIYIGYVHVAQLVAIIASGVGLFLLLCSLKQVLYNQIAFAIMIAASMYAIKTAASAVTVMHDLIWQKAIFDDFMTHQGDKKIVPFGRESDNG